VSGAFVPDASVAVKWILAEPQSEAASAWLDTSAKIFAPTLLLIEVASAITRRHRMGGLERPEAKEHLETAFKLIARPRVGLAPDSLFLQRAGEIALQISHPFKDCVYIACAERFEARLVTADASLHKRASVHFDFVKLL
jgi:predicted nucleic acid-binding protein